MAKWLNLQTKGSNVCCCLTVGNLLLVLI